MTPLWTILNWIEQLDYGASLLINKEEKKNRLASQFFLMAGFFQWFFLASQGVQFSIFSISALRIFFILYTIKEDNRQIKNILSLFPKKLLFGSRDYCGPENDTSSELWICSKHFLKIFHIQRGTSKIFYWCYFIILLKYSINLLRIIRSLGQKWCAFITLNSF